MHLHLLALLVAFITTVSSSENYDAEENFVTDTRHHIVKRQANQECKNKRGYCKAWKRRGHCQSPRYGPFMRKNCALSCGVCTATEVNSVSKQQNPTCVDINRSCASWKAKGFCQLPKYSDFMTKNCRKSCNWCIGTATPKTTQPAPTTPSATTTQEATTTQRTTASSTTIPTTEEVFTTSAAAETTEVQTTTLVTTEAGATTDEIVTTAPSATTMTTQEPTTEYGEETTEMVITTRAATTEDEETTEKIIRSTTQEVTTKHDEIATEVVATTGSIETSAKQTTEAYGVATVAHADETTISTELCVDILECETLRLYCSRSQYVKSNCRKTCGLCRTPSTTAAQKQVIEATAAAEVTTTLDITTAELILETTVDTTTPVSTTAQQECMDVSSRCSSFSSYCILSQYVRESCPKTCGGCGKPNASVSTQSLPSVLTKSLSTLPNKQTVITTTEPPQRTTIPVQKGTTDFVEQQTTEQADDIVTTADTKSEITTKYSVKLDEVTGTSKGITRSTQALTPEATDPSVTTTAVTINAVHATPTTPNVLTKQITAPSSASVYSAFEEPRSTLFYTPAITTSTMSSLPTTAGGILTGCFDQLSVCASYEESFCQSSAVFREYCPDRCGLCDTTTVGANGNADGATPSPSIAPVDCGDKAVNCAIYVNYCNISADVRHQCRKSCGLCNIAVAVTTEEVGLCIDLTPHCDSMKYFCTGSSMSGEVQMQCPKTCNICQKPTNPSTTEILQTESGSTTTGIGCQDYVENCNKLFTFCGTLTQVQASCPMTCGSCTPRSTPPGSEFAPPTTVPVSKYVPPVTTPTQLTTTTTLPPFSPPAQPTPSTYASTTEKATTYHPTSIPSVAEVCEDKFSWCEEIEANCVDVTAQEYLSVSCRKTCGFCKPEQPQQWTSWSACTVTCDQGTQTRSKFCPNSNSVCIRESQTQHRVCQIRLCVEQNTCHDMLALASCENYRTKGACSMPAISGLCLKTCQACPDVSPRRFPPGTAPSLTQGTFSTWSKWGPCSAKCGEGIMNRTRTCLAPVSGVESIFCDGLAIEQGLCFSKTCTSTTGQACENKNERCQSWAQKGYCMEKYTQYMKKNCPVSCNSCGLWENWTEWSECSRSCGGGQQERKRACLTVDCKGGNNDKKLCNTANCFTVPNASCEDAVSACARVDARTKCSDSFFSTVCKRTCGVCSTQTRVGCVDKDARCPAEAAAGRCSDLNVRSLCSKSCNLCVDSAGLQPSTQVCQDTDATCQTRANTGECVFPNVARACPRSCGLCVTPQSSATCLDQYVQCRSLAAQGRCALDRGVASQCKKSCGLCSSGTPDLAIVECRDSSNICSLYKQLGYCGDEATSRDCRQTCGYCATPCEDEDAACPSVARMGLCSNQQVTSSCRKSCNACSSNGAIAGTCGDESELCKAYAALDYCTQTQIANSCKKSCNKCPQAAPTCSDKNPQCPAFKLLQLCENEGISELCPLSCGSCDCQDVYPTCPMLVATLECGVSFVAENCKKSCKTCQKQSKEGECKDKIQNCQLIKSFGGCADPTMGGQCEKTCDVCGVKRKCEDEIPNCDTIVRGGMCSTGSVQLLCKRSCGVCTPSNNDEDDEEFLDWDWENVVPVPKFECGDRREECEKFREQGLCSQKYIRDSCNITCRVCTPINPGKIKVSEDYCVDALDECVEMAKGDGCTSDDDVRFRCAKSCSTCVSGVARKTKTLECKNTADGCEEKKEQCDDEDIAKICKRTCGVCDKEGSSLDSNSVKAPISYTPSKMCRDRMLFCPPHRCTREGKYAKYVHLMCANTCGRCLEGYGAWGTWGSCTKTCGGGSRKRKRECREKDGCYEPAPIDLGICGKDACQDNVTTEESKCIDYRHQCPDWANEGRCLDYKYKYQMAKQCALSCGLCEEELVGEWSACSVSCGGGTRSRERGDGVDVEGCGAEACPSPVVGWGEWSAWTDCSATCGGGRTSRERECVGKSDGAKCEGHASESTTCGSGDICDHVGEWGDWREGPCDVTCGEGSRKRERSCFDGIPGKGGCRGNRTAVVRCSMQDCVGPWSPWSGWTSCTVTCGTGYMSKMRSRSLPCDNPAEEYCAEDDELLEMCNTRDCNGAAWASWQPWTTCTTSCGGGSTLRQRLCKFEGRTVSSLNCSANDMDAFESGDCGKEPCATWGSWSKTSECSASCGFSALTRSRDCVGGKVGDPGCSAADRISVESCAKEPCTEACESEIGQVDSSTNYSYAASSSLGSFTPDSSWTGGKWCPRPDDVSQWIQVDLGASTRVSGVTIQGRRLNTFYQVRISQPMFIKVSHSPTALVEGERYIVQKHGLDGPTIGRNTVEMTWKPVTDRVWRISTKLPTDFACLSVALHLCRRNNVDSVVYGSGDDETS